MTAVGKRSFLVGMLAVAGVGILTCMCILLWPGTSYRGPEGALSVGFAVSFALVLAFAAYTTLDRPVWRVLALIGTALDGVGMLGMVAITLYELGGRYDPAVREFHLTDAVGTCLVLATLLCLGSCIGALRMKDAGRLLQIGTVASIVSGGLMILAFTWIPGAERSEGFGVLLGILIIASVGGILTTFVVYRFFGLKMPDPLSMLGGKIFLRCPRCLKEQELALGESYCAGCGLRFTLDMEEPKCPGCGYNLRALTRPVCPECGREITDKRVIAGEGKGELLAWARANDDEEEASRRKEGN